MNVERLKTCGVNYEAGVHRFGDNVAIYEKYLKKLPESDYITEAKEALLHKDVEEAFQVFHKMKAVVGNLSIDELFNQISEITEELRTGSVDIPETISKMEVVDQKLQVIIQFIQMED